MTEKIIFTTFGILSEKPHPVVFGPILHSVFAQCLEQRSLRKSTFVSKNFFHIFRRKYQNHISAKLQMNQRAILMKKLCLSINELS